MEVCQYRIEINIFLVAHCYCFRLISRRCLVRFPMGNTKICSTRFQSFVPKTIQQSSSGVEMKRREKEDWQFTTKREVTLLPRWRLYPTPNPVSLYVSYIVVRPCILNAWLCTHTTRILADSARKKIKLDKEEKRRQQSIKELIMTEQAYIDDMSVVHDVSTVQKK